MHPSDGNLHALERHLAEGQKYYGEIIEKFCGECDVVDVARSEDHCPECDSELFDTYTAWLSSQEEPLKLNDKDL